jgi:hypothetical protein
MIDRKGILSFLGITFAITYAIEGALILSGFRIERIPAAYGQLVVMVAMWTPTAATALTVKFVTHESFAITNLRFGSWKPYLASGLIIPLCFAVIYGLSWLMGLGQPDWELQQFKAMFVAAGAEFPPMPSPAVIWPTLFGATLVAGPLVNGLVALGEEIGWRGYLLPKLMPLGKLKAYVLMGVIWALWHLPLLLIGFVYPGQPLWGTLAFMALLVAFGIYINELSLRHRSSILAGWMHGVFNSQKLGVWPLLFPTLNPLIGGYAGIVGIAVWLALGLAEMQRTKGQG